MRRIAVVVGTMTLLATAAPASAAEWSGTCALTLTFNFETPVRAATPQWLTTPDYTITVAPAADLSANTPVVEPCAVSLTGTNPFRRTWVTASGTSDWWTCESTVASGTWSQGWYTSPSTIIGSHLVNGGPEAWTMVVHNWPTLSFVGTIDLTVHPDHAQRLAQCETSGISSLKMIGIMKFQYP